MRRGSLIGPLILILIGIVFLVKNLRPDLPLFDMAMTYWPFLLIVWGAVRLVEILVAYFAEKPLPMAGISGGEWALIIVLTLIGSSVWGVQRFSHDRLGRIRIGGVEVFGETYDYTVEGAKVKAAKDARVVITNQRGNTRVVGGDVEEVQIAGRKTVRAMDKASADKANEQAKVWLDVNGNVVSARAETDKIEGPRVTVDLEVTVPKGATVEFRGRNGDCDISSVDGDVDISSESGGVRVEKIGGKAKVDSRKSDIVRAVDVKGSVEVKGRGRDIELESIGGEVTISGSYSGETRLKNLAKALRFESSVTELRAERVPGEIELSLSRLSGENLVGPLVLKAQSKDVQLKDVANAIDVEVSRGDVEIRQTKGAAPKMDVRVKSGDIELALPPQSQFSVNAVTERGEISNSFDDRLKLAAEDNGGKLTGSVGTGPELKMHTARGAVTLRKIAPAEVSSVEKTPPPKPPIPPKPAKAIE